MVQRKAGDGVKRGKSGRGRLLGRGGGGFFRSKAAAERGVDFFQLRFRDTGEGDTHGSVVGRTVRATEVDGIFPERFVEGVDRGVEAGAGLFGFGREEIAGVG